MNGECGLLRAPISSVAFTSASAQGIARFTHGVAHVEHIVRGQSRVVGGQHRHLQPAITDRAVGPDQRHAVRAVQTCAGRTVMDVGAGAQGQSSAGLFGSVPYGVSLLPTRKRKSSTVGVPGRCRTSIIRPLMPWS